jgi:hypothetical protein
MALASGGGWAEHRTAFIQGLGYIFFNLDEVDSGTWANVSGGNPGPSPEKAEGWRAPT